GMNDYTLILIMIGIAATLILTAVYIWNVFFWRSWRKIIMMFLNVFNSSQDIVDPNKKIEPSKEIPRSQKIKARADESETEFEALLTDSRPPEVPKAHIPIQERGELAHDTSDNGWPRPLTAEEKQDSRPFRQVHLQT